LNFRMTTMVLRLDDLYKMIAHIYSEQNAHRPASATFSLWVPRIQRGLRIGEH
jgi:hypothetical protein